MSITVGIALPDHVDDVAIEQIKRAAEKSGYRLERGWEHAEQDMSEGFKLFLQTGIRDYEPISFTKVLFLGTPDNPNATLAFGVYKEFANWRIGGPRPIFLSFLSEISHIFEDGTQKARFVFCAEFEPADEVRIRRGKMSELIRFLELPEFWTLNLWSSGGGVVQETDRYPFVFCVN